MDGLFLTLFNMSVTATYLAVAVIILRLLLRRAPKWISVAMWALVGVRLVCPFSLESALSLIPSAEPVPRDIVFAKTPAINSGIYAVNSIVNPVLQENFTPTTEAASVNPIQIFLFILEIIWIVGIVGMLVYTAVSYAVVYRKVREAAPLRDNVWLCDRIASPFILGVIRPRIYLPSNMGEEDMEYVLSHERAHIRRRDHWWKPLGFLLLAVYWFNPVLWVAYILLCRDIELACDERVIKELGEQIKKPYSDALINCAAPRRYVTACPLAFGEVGVKTRIKSVLSYKKPAFWIIVVALLLCVALTVGFLTNPKSKVDDDLAVFIDCQIAEHNQNPYNPGDNACCVSWDVLGIEKNGDETTVYMWALYEEYSLGSDGKLKNETGSHIPTAVTAKKVNGTYQLVEYWIPRDGTYWAKDIMDKFPAKLWREATDSQRYIGKQKAECEEMAREYFASRPDIIVPNDGEGLSSDGPLYLQSLQGKYPEYFGLDTAMGLEVYWHQMAANNYNWVILPGRDEEYTWQDIINLPATTTGEMRAIVDCYDLPRSSVTVSYMGMPHSSYFVPYSEEYFAEVEEMFWNTVPMIDTNFAIPTYGSLVFDIDKDGVQEIVTLGMGTTSGVFSFSISASYNGEQKYRDYFLAPHSAPRFLVRDVDDVCVVITAQAEKGEAEVAILYEISVVNGHIMLTPADKAKDPSEVRNMLWQEGSTKTTFGGYFQTDLDQNGVGEMVWIEYDSDSADYDIVVRTADAPEYRKTFNAGPSHFPQFTISVELGSKFCLKLTPRYAGDSPVYYDVNFVDGEIVLTEIEYTE